MSDPKSTKPVFLLTHSRACSTAIERIFWTNDSIKCFHENFGGAFYFGPERISDNWKHWREDKIAKSGQGHVTWRSVLEELLVAGKSEEYVFIKDMSYHIIPPKGSSITELPSLRDWDDGAAEVRKNPTWLPTSTLSCFQFAFLVRSPWLAVPSLYRLHVPPRVYQTQLYSFKPAEIGYREMRVLIEYLYPQASADGGLSNYGGDAGNGPILIDASDVLTAPEETMGQFCDRVGLPFANSMLTWESHNPHMEEAMNKFKGYHDDAITSSGLRQRTQDEEEREKARGQSRNFHRQDDLGMEMTEEEYMLEWTARYGKEAADKILDAVYLCQTDYTWLRRFAIKSKTSSGTSA